MEKYYVKFEMDNGTTHSYEIKDTTVDGIYTKVVNSPDGWLEFSLGDEVHFLNTTKVTRVTTLSESAERKRDEESQAAFDLMRNTQF